jgi:uncharacterized protein
VPSTPLVVNAAELLRRPGSDRLVHLEVTPEELGIDDPRLVAGEPVVLDLRLEALTDGILVHGTVRARWAGVCRRCLTDVGGAAVADVEERYQLVLTDPDAFPLVDDQIDLRTVAGQLVLLEMPAAPLCREDCAGLCPICGVDRNTAICECTEAPSDSVWSVLEALRDPDEPAPG